MLERIDASVRFGWRRSEIRTVCFCFVFGFFLFFVHIVLALRDLAIEQQVCLNHGFIFVSRSRQTCGSLVVWRFDFTQRNGAALFDVFKLKLCPDSNSPDANDYFFKFMLNLYFTCQDIFTCVSSPLRYEGKWMKMNIVVQNDKDDEDYRLHHLHLINTWALIRRLNGVATPQNVLGSTHILYVWLQRVQTHWGVL